MKKKLIPLFLLAVIALMSCHSDRTKKDFLKASITKFKDTLEPMEIITYVPEHYAEVKTDTILSNGFTIRIKTYANMEASVLNQYKVASIIHKDHYREFVSEVAVYKKSKVLFHQTFNKSYFIKHPINSADNNVFKQLVFKEVAYDNSSMSNTDNNVALYVHFYDPFLKASLSYNMYIDSTGHLELNPT